MRYVLLCQFPTPDSHVLDMDYDYWIFDEYDEAVGDVTEEDLKTYENIEIVDLLDAGEHEKLVYRILIDDLIRNLQYMEEL